MTRAASDNGTLLADPENSTRIPMKRRGNNGIYGVFEQHLYRPQGGDADSGITVFGLASSAPQDRNLINFWFQTGLVFADLIPRRPDDSFGAIFEYARYSNGVRGNEYNEAFFSGVPQVIQDFEANLELTYLAQILPGWTMQPIVTYVWHPRGGLSSANALVIGVRSYWHY